MFTLVVCIFSLPHQILPVTFWGMLTANSCPLLFLQTNNFFIFFLEIVSADLLLFFTCFEWFFLTEMCNCLFQLLSVSAIVLANLCVSYIMTSQNEEVRSGTLTFSITKHQCHCADMWFSLCSISWLIRTRKEGQQFVLLFSLYYCVCSCWMCHQTSQMLSICGVAWQNEHSHRMCIIKVFISYFWLAWTNVSTVMNSE